LTFLEIFWTKHYICYGIRGIIRAALSILFRLICIALLLNALNVLARGEEQDIKDIENNSARKKIFHVDPENNSLCVMFSFICRLQMSKTNFACERIF